VDPIYAYGIGYMETTDRDIFPLGKAIRHQFFQGAWCDNLILFCLFDPVLQRD